MMLGNGPKGANYHGLLNVSRDSTACMTILQRSEYNNDVSAILTVQKEVKRH